MRETPRFHAHCASCMPQKPANQSMSDWARLDVFLTDTALEVHCKRCRKLVARFTPTQLQEQLDAPRQCDCCPGGRHATQQN